VLTLTEPNLERNVELGQAELSTQDATDGLRFADTWKGNRWKKRDVHARLALESRVYCFVQAILDSLFLLGVAKFG